MDAKWMTACLALLVALPAPRTAAQKAAPPPPPPVQWNGRRPPQWNGRRPPLPLTLELHKGDRLVARLEDSACGVTFSPDGKLLAAAGGPDVFLWDVQSGKQLRRLTGHHGFIRRLAFSPDGKLVAAAGDDRGVRLWETATGKPLRLLGHHNNGLRMVAFSPDGKTLVTSGFDEHIGLWDVASGKQLHLFRAHPRVPYSVAFSPDGKMLASGGDNEGTIRLWDATTGKELRSWQGHNRCVYGVAFSPDGRLLLTGGGDTTARLWEVRTGKEVRRLEGHKQEVSYVAFGANGRTLVTGSYSETVHVWETLTGKEIRRFGKHRGWVWGVACSPRGRLVASAGKDGAVVLWTLAAPAAVPARRPALPASTLDAAWGDLAGADAARAFQAVATLSSAPLKQVLPYLQRLQPAVLRRADAARLEQLIRDLDHRSFKVRQRARAELEKLGEAAAVQVRAALARPASVEVRRRLEELVAKLEARDVPPEQLRYLRALQVLEEWNTPETRHILKQLAGGTPGDAVTREAAAVLARLERRPPS